MKARKDSEGEETIVRIGGDTAIVIMMRAVVLREPKEKVLKGGIDIEADAGVGTAKRENSTMGTTAEKINVQKEAGGTANSRGTETNSTRVKKIERRGKGTAIDLTRGKRKEYFVLFLRETQ